jgi:hypothetical protein
MFNACIQNQDTEHGDLSGSRRSVLTAHDTANSGSLIDATLLEAAKLKAKCKSLKSILKETEDKRLGERQEFEHAVNELKMEYNTVISELTTQNYIQVLSNF